MQDTTPRGFFPDISGRNVTLVPDGSRSELGAHLPVCLTIFPVSPYHRISSCSPVIHPKFNHDGIGLESCPRTLCAFTHRVPSRGRRADCTFQLALRAQDGRDVHSPD